MNETVSTVVSTVGVRCGAVEKIRLHATMTLKLEQDIFEFVVATLLQVVFSCFGNENCVDVKHVMRKEFLKGSTEGVTGA